MAQSNPVQFSDLPDNILYRILLNAALKIRLTDPACSTLTDTYRCLAPVCRRWFYILRETGVYEEIKEILQARDMATRYLTEAVEVSMTRLSAEDLSSVGGPPWTWMAASVDDKFFYVDYIDKKSKLELVYYSDVIDFSEDDMTFLDRTELFPPAPFIPDKLLACQASSTLYVLNIDVTQIYRCQIDGTPIGHWIVSIYINPALTYPVVRHDVIVFVNEYQRIILCHHTSPTHLTNVILDMPADTCRYITGAALENRNSVIVCYKHASGFFRIARLRTPPQLIHGGKISLVAGLGSYNGPEELGPAEITQETVGFHGVAPELMVDTMGCVLVVDKGEVKLLDDFKSGKMRVVHRAAMERAFFTFVNESQGILFQLGDLDIGGDGDDPDLVAVRLQNIYQ